MEPQQHYRRFVVLGENGRATVELFYPIINGVYEMIPAIPFRNHNRNIIFSHMCIEDDHFLLCESNNNHINEVHSRMKTQDVIPIYGQDGHYVIQESNSNQNNQTPTGRITKVTVQNLERIRIDEETIAETLTCSICLEEFLLGSKAIRLPSPCSHIYHENCIMKWLNRSNTCPLCRRPISCILLFC
uniref:E3 ubiquitin-protein ligase RNF126-like n=1 Tax=Cicer arietinum TaxID=3827 RepID=A0A3Q7YA47_CICAR|nr:E3 ubiquitin-protein ligase RNF126-like [Cicer arietinum]